MKVKNLLFVLIIVVGGLTFFSNCTIEKDVNTVYKPRIVGNPIAWNPAMSRLLTSKVDINKGDEIVLDNSDPNVDQFIKQRLALGGKTFDNSPQLFRELERTRQMQLLRRSRGETTEAKVPEGDGHLIIKLAEQDDGSIVASTKGSVRVNEGYFFLDIVAFDNTNVFKTEYEYNDSFDAGVRSLACTSKGVSLVRSRAPGEEAKGVNADTLMMYMTKDADGDGVEELAQPALKISYTYSGISLGGTIYPSTLVLQHPVENNALATYDNPAVCTICLNRSAQECDYDLDSIEKLYGKGVYTTWGDILMPFKGTITYKGYKIVTITDGNGISKPDPAPQDETGKQIRKIDLALCLEDAGGIVKKQTPAATDFFWSDPNTVATYDWTKNESTLSWNLLVNFGNKVFKNSDHPKFFVTIDVPVVKSDPIPFRATAFIIPRDYFADTPYKYNPFLTKLNVAAGTHTLSVTGSAPGAGTNQPEANATVYTWTVDDTPPEASLINKPPQFTKNKKAQITVGGTDVVAYSYKLDASIDNTNFPGDWSPAIDVKQPIVTDVSDKTFTSIIYKLYVVGIDRAGNKQAIKAAPDHTWLISASNAPEACLSSLPAYFSNSSSIAVVVEGDGLVSYDYQLDSNAKVTGRGIGLNITASSLTDGEHTLQVWGRNSSSLQSNQTKYTWIVDRTAPVAALYMAKTADNKSSITDFVAEVGGTDIYEYEYQIDANPLQKVSGDTLISATGLAAGNHTLNVYGYDRAGNKQTTATTYQWQIDTTLKYVALWNVPRLYTSSKSLNVELKGSAVKTYKYKLDADAWSIDIPLQDLMTMPDMQFVWSCIAAGSEIRMADGSTKAIENIKEGEWVLSDNNTKLPVHMVTTGIEPIPMYRIIDDLNHSLLLTHGHPVIMTNNKKKLARDLHIGDKIMSSQGPATVVSVTTEKYSGTIYNLTLGTNEQIVQNNKEGFTMFANGILIGDNNMQTTQMNLAYKPNGDLLARIPAKWFADYLMSPLLHK